MMFSVPNHLDVFRFIE